MIGRTILLRQLIQSGRWRAEFHVHGDSEIHSGHHKMMRLADVVVESKKAIDPTSFEEDSFYYIGLEHVESVTGDPVGIVKVGTAEVRSRSKTFAKGDVLYGRLRAYLRKAFLVDDPYDKGLCSTEFIILQVDESIISNVYLRELLISDRVTERLTRMQGGAALPRVSSKDLLDLKVPIPPLDVQQEIASKLTQIKRKRHELRCQLENLVREGQETISGVF